ncbi:MAG TPA: YqeG family HAD IIIA-type phosphatase [Armatimonadetes bacterium]|nr:YqeG family HAD IIIA-type phosphatase [Armatimonadota bacterium]
MRMLLPKLYVPSLLELRFEVLEKHGIQGLILDLDNTLVVRNRYEVPEAIRKWIAEAKARGFKLCLTSNSNNRWRVQHIAEGLSIPYVAWAMKPRRWGFRTGMELMGTAPEATAVIGDQMFTDIWGGNRLGLFTVLVQPMSTNDFFATKWLRRVERWLLRRRERAEEV